MLGLFLFIIAVRSIGACQRSPPSEYQSIGSFVSFHYLEIPITFSTGIQCFQCEFNNEDLKNVFDINGSGGMPNCAFDHLYHFDKAQNLTSVFGCKSCVKANVYLKGDIIFPQCHHIRQMYKINLQITETP